MDSDQTPTPSTPITNDPEPTTQTTWVNPPASATGAPPESHTDDPPKAAGDSGAGVGAGIGNVAADPDPAPHHDDDRADELVEPEGEKEPEATDVGREEIGRLVGRLRLEPAEHVLSTVEDWLTEHGIGHRR